MARVDSRRMAEGIVITGIGAVTGLGGGAGQGGAAALLNGLLEGRSAIRPIESFDAGGFASDLASWIDGLDAKGIVPKHYRKAVKVMARDTQIAVVAAAMAAEDAGLVTRVTSEETTYPSERMGCLIGAGLIAAEATEVTSALAPASDEHGTMDLRAWGEGAMEKLPPLWMLKYLPNMLACHVTILHGCTGVSNTITFGEASGLLSIGESMRVIERGDADACFSGSAESKLNVLGLTRLEQAGRIAQTRGKGLNPSERSEENPVRPFDPASSGQLLGEGGGILIVEREQTARERGAKIAARLVGFGAAHSARGLDTLRPIDSDENRTNQGLSDAIERALGDAGIGADEIDAIVPHGAGVAAMDRAEGLALGAVFGDRAVPTLCWTPSVGECMAGNGGIQAAIGAIALADGRWPRTPRLAGGRMLGGPEPADVPRHVLVCSASLGGSNAALVLRRAD